VEERESESAAAVIVLAADSIRPRALQRCGEGEVYVNCE
jgi:hypothetical protein